MARARVLADHGASPFQNVMRVYAMLRLVFAAISVFALLGPGALLARGNGFVHVQDGIILGPNGQPFHMKGIHLEGWLMWQGPFWESGLKSESELVERFVSVLGESDFLQFQAAFYDRFIAEQDVVLIKSLGFNTIRLSFNHTVLEQDAKPYQYRESGWELIDRFLGWAEKHEVYVILALHAAPGGQSDTFVSDPDRTNLWESEENRKRTIALWRAIASRYAKQRFVYGYELLNEPVAKKWTDLIGIYSRITSAIREVDQNHMIIYQGNKHGREFSGFSEPLDANAALSYHTYRFAIIMPDITEEMIQDLGKYRATHQIPYINTEFGANDLEWTMSRRKVMDGSDGQGWVFWPYKRVPAAFQRSFRHLVGIEPTEDWSLIRGALDWPALHRGKKDEVMKALYDYLEASEAKSLNVDQEMLEALGLSGS
jgi:endoglucanase